MKLKINGKLANFNGIKKGSITLPSGTYQWNNESGERDYYRVRIMNFGNTTTTLNTTDNNTSRKVVVTLNDGTSTTYDSITGLNSVVRIPKNKAPFTVAVNGTSGSSSSSAKVVNSRQSFINNEELPYELTTTKVSYNGATKTYTNLEKDILVILYRKDFSSSYKSYHVFITADEALTTYADNGIHRNIPFVVNGGDTNNYTTKIYPEVSFTTRKIYNVDSDYQNAFGKYSYYDAVDKTDYGFEWIYSNVSSTNTIKFYLNGSLYETLTNYSSPFIIGGKDIGYLTNMQIDLTNIDGVLLYINKASSSALNIYVWTAPKVL